MEDQLAIEEANEPAKVEEVRVPEQLEEWNAIPKEKDGWVMVHNAIRLDMTDYLKCLEKLEENVRGGKAEAWMGSNLRTWFTNFYKNVHEHHDHEEEIFFPAINKKVTLPPKMTSDHKTLMAALDDAQARTETLSKALEGKQESDAIVALIQDLKEKFVAMQTSMCEHLQEEEEVGLPLFRANFTIKEARDLEKEILKDMKPISLGWFLRPVQDDEEKKLWMKDFAKIPLIPRALILFPIAKNGGKYYQQFTRLLDEVEQAKKIDVSKPCCLVM